MPEEQQHQHVIKHLQQLLEDSPLLETERKARLEGILLGQPSRRFLRGLYKLLTEEAEVYEQILEEMSDEEVKDIYFHVLGIERSTQQNKTAAREEHIRTEEEQLLSDMESYFSK